MHHEAANGTGSTRACNRSPCKHARLSAARSPALLPGLRRLWEISWPLSGMEVLTFAKELIITAFVGHLGPFELSSLVLSLTFYNVSSARLVICNCALLEAASL